MNGNNVDLETMQKDHSKPVAHENMKITLKSQTLQSEQVDTISETLKNNKKRKQTEDVFQTNSNRFKASTLPGKSASSIFSLNCS